jgi:protein-tyrosine-phosphatase
MRITPHQAQQGFLTIVQNTDVNYLRLAYLQAMSIKLIMPDSSYAIIVDENTAQQVTDKYHKVFDYVITLNEDHAKNQTWKLSNEWQVFYLTPFKETIKLESDLIFTRSIKHWWTTFRLKNLVLSYGCKDYQQNTSTCRKYRKLFDDNELPDVYNGLMYFRYSQESNDFFNLAREIFANWEYIRDHTLQNCRDDEPTTDVVYAIAANILGIENCTLPGLDFINFVHMKSAINGFSQQIPWYDSVLSETELPMIRINNINQYYPLHYYDKDWASDKLIEEYENELARRI